jgi:hypothetical protein
LLLTTIVVLTGCQTATFTPHRVHYSFIESPDTRAPKKVVVLPPQVTVMEMSAGGVVEKVGEWTDQANRNVAAAARRYLSSSDRLRLVEMPKLSAPDQQRLEEHVALYDLVAGAALTHTSGGIEAWEHKRQRFDYTLGNGLKTLKERTGADAAIIFVGEDRVSSAGRKAAFVVAAAMGVAIPMGHSFLSAGVVDLVSGDILWLNRSVSTQGADLRNAEDAQAMVDAMFANYPGLEPYLKTKAQP